MAPRQSRYDKTLAKQGKKRIRFNSITSDNLRPDKLSSVEVDWLVRITRALQERS